MRYVVASLLTLVLSAPVAAQQEEAPIVEEAPSIELRYGGHLGKTVDGSTGAIPQGGTRSYTLRLRAWPEGATSITVQIENQSPEVIYLHSEEITFTELHYRKRQHVKVTGVATGTATLSHSITGFTVTPSSLTFDVEEGRGHACTHENVKRIILGRLNLGDVFAPGKFASDCAVVGTDDYGTAYAYPFEVYEYLGDEAIHYSWAVVYVDNEHRIDAFALRNRDYLHKTARSDRVGPSQIHDLYMATVTNPELIGRPFGALPGVQNLRKSTCGFSTLSSFVDYAFTHEDTFDGTRLGWDRGCLIEANFGDSNRDFSGIMTAQPVNAALSFEGTMYHVLMDRVEVVSRRLRFYVAKESIRSKGYDNVAFINNFRSGGVLAKGGLLDKTTDGDYRVTFVNDTLESTPSPITFRPDPFPLD